MEPTHSMEKSLKVIFIRNGAEFLPYYGYTFTQLGHMGIDKGREKYRLENVMDYFSNTRVSIHNRVQVSGICYPVSVIRHLLSGIRHLVSGIWHPVSVICLRRL